MVDGHLERFGVDRIQLGGLLVGRFVVGRLVVGGLELGRFVVGRFVVGRFVVGGLVLGRRQLVGPVARGDPDSDAFNGSVSQSASGSVDLARPGCLDRGEPDRPGSAGGLGHADPRPESVDGSGAGDSRSVAVGRYVSNGLLGGWRWIVTVIGVRKG